MVTSEKTREHPFMKIFFTFILLALLLSCATQQNRLSTLDDKPDAAPKVSRSQLLAEKITGALDKLNEHGLPEEDRKELMAKKEALTEEYFALNSEEQNNAFLQSSMDRLFSASSRIALENNRAPEPANEEEASSPTDELLETTTFLSPDELDETFREVQKAKEKIKLGIQIPLDNPVVLTYVKLYQTKLKKWFTGSLERGNPHIPEVKAIFKDEGVPPELVYLGIVESAFKPNAKSRAGALGMWQFMKGTAINYGLTVDFWQDERLDLWKSSRASAKYLNFLHTSFNDWNLALAAYNCGEGKIIKQLKLHPGRDFWTMRNSRVFRRETKEYVPAILAAILIASDPKSFGMEPASSSPNGQSALITLNKQMDLRILARHLDIPVEILLSLNPSLKRIITPPGKYDLRIPADKYEKAENFQTDKAFSLLPQYVIHTVKRRESIKSVARKHKCDPLEIQTLNIGLGGRLEFKSMILVIPGGTNLAVARQENLSTVSSSETKIHVVKKGDTLSKIGKRYGVTVKELCEENGISPRKILRIGMKIRIPL